MGKVSREGEGDRGWGGFHVRGRVIGGGEGST